MAILGIDKIKELKLVENLSKRELENPEGCAVEVRAGEIYEMVEGKGFLGVETRKTPSYKLVGKHEEGEKKVIVLEPGKFYSVKTIEKVNVPLKGFARFYPRSTLFRSGIVVSGQYAAPGYKGNFNFGLINVSKNNFELELGARIAAVVFHEVKGETSAYRGQWQGGRVFVDKEEKHV
jgi:deoxycytidine triphosphate deaminase